MCQKSTAHEQRAVVLVESQGSCALVRIVRLQKFDRRDNMIFSVHLNRLIDKNTLLEQSTIEACPQEAYKYRDWTASRWWTRWRSQSSSCQPHVITSRGLIPADHEYLDSVAWPCHDCEVAPVWHHDVINARTCQFFAVCLTVFPFEFRPRTFTIGFYGKNSIISELMILECSFPLTHSWVACAMSYLWKIVLGGFLWESNLLGVAQLQWSWFVHMNIWCTAQHWTLITCPTIEAKHLQDVLALISSPRQAKVFKQFLWTTLRIAHAVLRLASFKNWFSHLSQEELKLDEVCLSHSLSKGFQVFQPPLSTTRGLPKFAIMSTKCRFYMVTWFTFAKPNGQPGRSSLDIRTSMFAV